LRKGWRRTSDDGDGNGPEDEEVQGGENGTCREKGRKDQYEKVKSTEALMQTRGNAVLPFQTLQNNLSRVVLHPKPPSNTSFTWLPEKKCSPLPNPCLEWNVLHKRCRVVVASRGSLPAIVPKRVSGQGKGKAASLPCRMSTWTIPEDTTKVRIPCEEQR
jgi:hypothetical protein